MRISDWSSDVCSSDLTTGTTGLPKAVYFTHRQLVLHTLATLATYGTAAVQVRLHQADVYMPITPMFHVHAWGLPYAATTLGLKQIRSEEQTSELQSLMRRKYAIVYSKKKKQKHYERREAP